jgi:GR25 family glycosyltransferase involved in LPS biosynthesis
MDFKKKISHVLKNFHRSRMLRTGLFFEKIFYIINPQPQRLNFIYFIHFKLMLKKIFRNNPGEPDYKVYVINLDSDLKRMKSFDQRAKDLGIVYSRVSGLDARKQDFSFLPYQYLLGNEFYGNNLFPRGSFASFLSHRQVWLRFLDTSNSVALICEDDALPLGPLPKLARDFHFPDGADVVFANTRMGQGFFTKKYYETGHLNRPNYYGVFEALMNICHEKIYIGGPGLDGYFVTRQGAQKLLALYDEVKYSMNNDWFVVLNSLSNEERTSFLKAEGTGRMDKVHLPEGPRLQSYVMVPSLVELADFSTSIRMMDPSMLATREEIICGDSNASNN